MHVVHLGKYYYPAVGGMESLIRSQAQAQASKGLKVDVVVVNHIDRNGRNLKQSVCGSCTTETIQDGMVTVHRVGRVFNFAKLDIGHRVGHTLANIAKQKPDLWHLHTPNATMVVALQTHLKECQPLVVSHHSDILNQRWLKPAYELLETRVYRSAAMLISDSPNYVNGSRQLCRFPEKLKILPLGINVSEYEHPTEEVKKWERSFRSRFGEPLWLAVGRLSRYKGLEIAFQSLKQVPGQLAIVGEGPCRSRWQSESERQGVADRVHWLGKLSDEQLKGIYRAATALWFPSNARNEGFGIVQVEAMASGCPVINTNLKNSGVAWVSMHEISGLTAECNSVDSFVACCKRLIEEPGLRSRLAKRAPEIASDRFSQHEINDSCLKLYGDVLSRFNNQSVDRQRVPRTRRNQHHDLSV